MNSDTKATETTKMSSGMPLVASKLATHDGVTDEEFSLLYMTGIWGWVDHVSIIQYYEGKIIGVCDIGPYNQIPVFINCDELRKMAEDQETKYPNLFNKDKPERLCEFKHILHTTYTDEEVHTAIYGKNETAESAVVAACA